MHSIGVVAATTASFLFLPFLASYATASDACPKNDVCLETFRYCNDEGDGDDAQCNFPDDENIQQQDVGTANPYFIIYAETIYNISWANESENGGPVWVLWQFQDGAGNMSTKWIDSTNDGFYMFSPDAILQNFPTEYAPSLNFSEAAVGAANYANKIIVTQQLSLDDIDEEAASQSDSFSVLNKMAFQTIQSLRSQQVDEEKEDLRSWRIGVGVGVGVGVPILMGLSFLAGKRQGRSKSKASGSI